MARDKLFTSTEQHLRTAYDLASLTARQLSYRLLNTSILTRTSQLAITVLPTKAAMTAAAVMTVSHQAQLGSLS